MTRACCTSNTVVDTHVDPPKNVPAQQVDQQSTTADEGSVQVQKKVESSGKPTAGMSKFAIVTGASRGFGRGAAKILAEEGGYTVFVCARSEDKLKELATEVEAKGSGKIVPYKLDQSRDGSEEEIKKFVDMAAAAAKEAGTGISLLVNSAYKGLEAMTPLLGKPFWEQPVPVYDAHLDVGARSSYIMSLYVIPKMIEAGVTNGMIIQTSSYGGFMYLFSPGYSVGHAAMDRLSWDMAVDLGSMEETNGTKGAKIRTCTLHAAGGSTEIAAFPDGETPIYAGRAILALHADSTTPAFLDKINGKVVFTGDLSQRTVEKDGLDGSVIIENKDTVEEALEVNKKRYEGLAAFPGLINGSLPAKARGENDLEATLPQMAAGFNAPAVADFFPGYKK